MYLHCILGIVLSKQEKRVKEDLHFFCVLLWSILLIYFKHVFYYQINH